MSITPSYEFPPDTLVGGRYVLHEILGHGGFGIVYRVSDQTFSPPVEKAIKFLRLTRDVADWRWGRFLEEAALLARLNHQGLVKVMDQNIHEGFLYFVMEYLGQETLRSIIKRCPRGLPLARATKAIRQLGEVLAAVHRLHLYHCDLKPANIMLCSVSGGVEQAKIIDFGTARLTDPLRTQEQNLPFPVGTWKYMAPEQFSVAADSVQITAATDIYAFGIIAYQMLTGQCPFDNRQEMILTGSAQDALRIPATRRRPELNCAVDKILQRALAYSPGARYQDAEEFAECLVAAVEMKHPQIHSIPSCLLPSAQVLLLAADTVPDQEAAAQLVRAFHHQGVAASYTDGDVGIEIAEQLEERLRHAQLVVALVSTESLGDAVWRTLMAQASDLINPSDQQQRVVLLTLADNLPMPGEWHDMQLVRWRPSAPETVVTNILNGPSTPSTLRMVYAIDTPPEPPVGALRPRHPLYVERAADAMFLESVERRHSIVLVQGPRQFGKSSLLARGIERAGRYGFRVVSSDFQSLDRSQFDSLETFYLALGRNIARYISVPRTLHETWDDLAGPNENFAEYMCNYVLAENEPHLLWTIDEADKLFSYPYQNDVFAMFRSWHNARSSDTAEGRAWGRLTLVISYTTEASRFISDQNQSPFNVGIKCELPNFDPAQIAELNRRYGLPLKHEEELLQFYADTGGHPFLTQQGLGLLARRGEGGWDAVRQEAVHHVGPFGEHLRRLTKIIRDHPRMQEGMTKLLHETGELTTDEFYDLRASGLVTGQDPAEARLDSQLYADFFRRELSEVTPPLSQPKGPLTRFRAWLKTM